MIGAVGSSVRVGPSTDSPPTPESKNSMGAFASTAALWRDDRPAASCAAVPVCYSTFHDPRDALRFGAWLFARIDPVRAGADTPGGQRRHSRHRLRQYRG